MNRIIDLQVIFPKQHTRKKQRPKTKAYLVLEFKGETTRIIKGYLSKAQANDHRTGLKSKKYTKDGVYNDGVSYGVIKVSLQGKRD